MSVEAIISYDGTANDDDALALGRLLTRDATELALAYVRHAPELDPSREALAQHDAERRLEQLNRRQRVTCPTADLVVGLQCGGSDAFSGVTCNPAVGYAADLLVRAGATVMFSEVTEVRDAIDRKSVV